MSLHKLTSLFTSVRDSNAPYLYPNNVKGSDGKYLMLATPDIVDETEKYLFDIFLYAIGVPSDGVQNYGIVKFTNDVFDGHCPVFFGISPETGELGITIGLQSDQFGSSSVFVPCGVEEKIVKQGQRELKTYEYSLNGHPLELVEYLDNENKGTGKFFIKTAKYVDESTYDNYEFSFPFLIDKSREFSPAEVNKAWHTGEFINICREFGTGGGRLWLQANKAFQHVFTTKQFPKEGVLLLCKNATYKFAAAGSHPNIKNDINSMDWEIVATSHPELTIENEVKKDGKKVREPGVLSDATNIQFTDAKMNNEGYHFPASKPNKEYKDCVLIHIVRPSSRDLTHMPVNTATNLLPRVMAKIAKYPHLKEIIEGVKSEFVSLEGRRSKESLPNGVTVSKSIEAYKTSTKETLINDFPKAPEPVTRAVKPDSQESEDVMAGF